MQRLGSYEILKRLGEGGMATAWLGRAPDGRVVVLKVPLEASAEMAIKLRDEAQAGFRIKHPNVVETIDYFMDLGRPVLVVDYIDGCPLRDLRRLGGRPNPLPPAAVAWLGRSIAEGLSAIHDAVDENGRPLKMLHRDVTPSNVLIGKDGVPKLIDLGIARSSENQQERTQVGMLKGTLRYVAPELLAGEPYSAATDLWSLGVCLFEAALGRQMVSGEAVQIFRQLTMGTYRDLRPGESIHPDLAVAIFALVTEVGMRLRNARAAAAVFARLEQKLIAEDPQHYAGRSWLVSWVPWAHENEDDRDLAGGEAPPSPAAPAVSAPASVAVGPSPTPAPRADPVEPPRVRTVLGDGAHGTTPTIAMSAAKIVPPAPQAPLATLVLPRTDGPAPRGPEPLATLVLPQMDLAVPPSGPTGAGAAGPAETLVLPRAEVGPAPAAPDVALVMTPAPARPMADLTPTIPEAPRPMEARIGRSIGIGVAGIGPTLVLPRVDIRPSSPGIPLSAVTPERVQQRLAPRLVDDGPAAEAAPGDVLPEGASTIQMPAFVMPPEAIPPPSSADARPTVAMPAARVALPVPPRPSGEAAPTILINSADVPGPRDA